MNHILVLPEEFETNLNDAFANNDIHAKWLRIGIDTVLDMKNSIIAKLNEKYPKLNITGFRIESKQTIKERIENNGSTSVYAGYIEKENGNIDGLFFYIPPSLNSGNDFLTRQVFPSLIGIYENISPSMEDMHFNSRPIYILNINETNRSEQRAVKISFLCAELLGFYYLDIFERDFHDIVSDGDNNIPVITLTVFNSLFATNGDNEWFTVNHIDKTLKLLSSRVTSSSNPSAEIYRYALKVLPAIYMAIEEGYRIDLSDFENVNVGMFRTYLSKI